MSVAFVGACAVAGAGVGGLLTTVIHRVPAAERLRSPGPRCPHCAAAVRGWAVVPVASWLALRGRCQACRTPIGVAYPLVELATAGLFAVLAWRLGPAPDLPAHLYLAAVGIALAVVDVRTHRLPDRLTLPAYPVVAGLLAAASLVVAEWTAFGRAALGMAALFACYYLFAVVAPAGLGFGDVKLAGVLGLALGWAGWASLAAGAFLGFLYGGVTSVVLLSLGRVSAHSRIPFGPFMLAGAFTALLLGDEAVAGYLALP